ncbi:hypothetical protein [Marinivivus vitaminiproducens]|uniref:hypothetical protein n=1 Tax=Marinivivus vitaminiproducens TaxID=3035935 RepID=UPI0027A39DD5|nr:hypothetical protein P4R82_05520 [Geminicoccaceae bacterium SCSIO 64248]
MTAIETEEELADAIREASELEKTADDAGTRKRLADLKAAIADFDRRHANEMTKGKPATGET